MITVDAAWNGTGLLVICSGSYSDPAEGGSFGNLLKNTIRSYIEGEGDRPAEIVIDFTRVDYLWGDYPVWPVVGWARYSRITYLVNDRNDEMLRSLFSILRLDKFYDITITRDKDA